LKPTYANRNIYRPGAYKSTSSATPNKSASTTATTQNNTNRFTKEDYDHENKIRTLLQGVHTCANMVKWVSCTSVNTNKSDNKSDGTSSSVSVSDSVSDSKTHTEGGSSLTQAQTQVSIQQAEGNNITQGTITQAQSNKTHSDVLNPSPGLNEELVNALVTLQPTEYSYLKDSIKQVCTHIHTHTQIYIHTYTQIYIHTCVFTYIHIHMHISTYIHILINIHIYTFTHIHTITVGANRTKAFRNP